jgi:ABC-type multidrug transport system ATPase subunit
MIAVTVRNISKKYGDVAALSDIGFDVERGGMFGIIGPDGAGKTTLFRILTTLLRADSGTVTVDGCDIVKEYRKIRTRIGYMPGKFSLYQDLTVEENLKVFATVFNTTIGENYHLIKDIYRQIEPFRKRRAGALSGGMKQKLALSCALIHKPSVLFLDEPTTGVDPVSRREFWEMLRKLKLQGMTILVSTSYMDEARLCDRIGLIRSGRFLRIDAPDTIVAGFGKTLWSIRAASMYKLLLDVRLYPGVASCFAFGDTHHVTLHDDALEISSVERYLQENGHVDIKIAPISPTIEDCFMALSK